MSVAHRSGTRAIRALVGALVVPAVAACSFLTGVKEPEELHLTLDSDAGELTLVTSSFFVLVPDPECPECDPFVQLVSSDTTVVSPPFERTYAFTSRQQYFIEVWHSEAEAATVVMKVLIDDEVWYDDFRELVPQEGEEVETVRFVYNFSELVF